VCICFFIKKKDNKIEEISSRDTLNGLGLSGFFKNGFSTSHCLKIKAHFHRDRANKNNEMCVG
jgi:hypothetical protein